MKHVSFRYRLHCKLPLSLPHMVNTTEVTQSEWEWQYDCVQKMVKKWPYLTSWPNPTHPRPMPNSVLTTLQLLTRKPDIHREAREFSVNEWKRLDLAVFTIFSRTSLFITTLLIYFDTTVPGPPFKFRRQTYRAKSWGMHRASSYFAAKTLWSWLQLFCHTHRKTMTDRQHIWQRLSPFFSLWTPRQFQARMADPLVYPKVHWLHYY